MNVRKRFSDFSQERQLTGDKLRMDDILNKEIYITGFRLMPSKCVKDKDCLQLQFQMDEREFVVFTNSEVLTRQIQNYQEHIPFLTTVIKRNAYYTFS